LLAKDPFGVTGLSVGSLRMSDLWNSSKHGIVDGLSAFDDRVHFRDGRELYAQHVRVAEGGRVRTEDVGLLFE
jgi:hypothetical protein